MKKIQLLTVVLTVLFFAQCSEKYPKTIERPVYGLQNSKTLELDKVVLTDTATILYVDAYFYPKNWIRIDSATYLQANGQKYLITGSEGIILNNEHWMPDTGEEHFKLFFPPLPKGTKTFDFIESDCDECFKIWDIDLTGSPKKYTPELPKEFLTYQADKNIDFENPVYKIAKTKVNVHFTGLKEGYALPMTMYASNMFTFQQDEVEPEKINDNEYVFVFDLFSSTSATLRAGNNFFTIIIDPGEEVDFYYDATADSKRKSRYNPQSDMIYAGFTGKYAQINSQLMNIGDLRYKYSINAHENLSILDKSSEDFVDYLMQSYKENVKRIDSTDINLGIKQLLKEDMKSSIINYVVSMKRLYEHVYRQKNDLEYNDPIDFEGPVPTDKEYLLLKELELNNPISVYSSSFAYAAPTIASAVSSEEKLNELTGTQEGLLQDIRKTRPIMTKAINAAELTPNDEKVLQSASNTLYPEVYKFIMQKSKREYEEAMAEGGFIMKNIPDVAADKILDAIIAEYKGKVVFVDFWATWCGPCINAMKTIKPFKPEMAEKGVVSVYISNASSPRTKWISMLPDIGGLHYYLDEAQWKIISDKYNIQGIPTYMVFDKAGKKTFETAGYPGNDRIREELSKIW